MMTATDDSEDDDDDANISRIETNTQFTNRSTISKSESRKGNCNSFSHPIAKASICRSFRYPLPWSCCMRLKRIYFCSIENIENFSLFGISQPIPTNLMVPHLHPKSHTSLALAGGNNLNGLPTQCATGITFFAMYRPKFGAEKWGNIEKSVK